MFLLLLLTTLESWGRHGKTCQTSSGCLFYERPYECVKIIGKNVVRCSILIFEFRTDIKKYLNE